MAADGRLTMLAKMHVVSPESTPKGAPPWPTSKPASTKPLPTSKNLPEKPDNTTLLKIYALYKQASSGDVDGKRPGFTDMVGRAKWDAWNDLKGKEPTRRCRSTST